MVSHIGQVLTSENPASDSPRTPVFELQRPPIEHIKPPDMDLSAHVLSASCDDFEFESDEDDDEAYVPAGRISPCTFLAWSRECKRWDADRLKIPTDKVSYT
jgi:hypothetical protein